MGTLAAVLPPFSPPSTHTLRIYLVHEALEERVLHGLGVGEGGVASVVVDQLVKVLDQLWQVTLLCKAVDDVLRRALRGWEGRGGEGRGGGEGGRGGGGEGRMLGHCGIKIISLLRARTTSGRV